MIPIYLFEGVYAHFVCLFSFNFFFTNFQHILPPPTSRHICVSNYKIAAVSKVLHNLAFNCEQTGAAALLVDVVGPLGLPWLGPFG